MTVVGLRERKRLETRDRIIRSAIALFEQRGIEAVTVEDIAAAADVGKGTIYNYFTAKEDIIVSFLLEIDRKALEAIPALAISAATPADALDAAAWSLMENKTEHRAFVRAFLARLVSAEGFAQELSLFQAALDRSLESFFENLFERGDAHSPGPVAELILSFKTMHLGLNLLWTLEGPPFAATRALTRRHMTLFAKELES